MPRVSSDGFRVSIRGKQFVERALRRLPRQAEREVKNGMERLSRELANLIRAAGRAESPQAARASRTVRTARGVTPQVVAGPHPFLFGSEFGVKRRFGWYRKGRYYNSDARQFKAHRGNASYWFFDTYDREEPRIRAAGREISDAIIRAYGA
jgi:hypothetical protein